MPEFKKEEEQTSRPAANRSSLDFLNQVASVSATLGEDWGKVTVPEKPVAMNCSDLGRGVAQH